MRVRHILRGPSGSSITGPEFTARRCCLHDPDAQVPPVPLLSCLLFSFCLLLLETEHLMEKASSGNSRFLPCLPGLCCALCLVPAGGTGESWRDTGKP